MATIFILTIIYFFILLSGLGQLFALREKTISKLAIGLALIPVLGVLLNLLHVPLDWRIFLGLALVGFCHQFIRWRKAGGAIKIKIKRPSWQTALVLIVFCFTLVIYCGGAFQYPWLEDDDPWSHAASIKYVSVEKNINAPDGTFQYLNPYPPGYAILFGLLHQINPSLYWTLKFFNGFLICLGFLFFYVFAEELTQNKSKAVLATFFLTLIPCYLTHFIWAHSLVITLFFPAFYFLLKSLKDRSYILPAGICWASILLVQPTQPIKFAIMAVLLIVAYSRTGIRWRNLLMIAALSGSICLFWWGPIFLKSLAGQSNVLLRDGESIVGRSSDTGNVVRNIFSPTLGTGTQAYSWKHFISPPDPNLINNPVGLTPVICLIALLGISFSFIKTLHRNTPARERSYLITLFLWIIFTFLGINSMTFHLPVGLFAFRFWMLFAIPIALLCAEGFFSFTQFMKIKRNQYLIAGILISATIRSTLPLKWWFNTTEWSYGLHWVSDEDIQGYIWMRRNLPVNTKIFSFTDNILVLGHNMRSDFWSPEYQKQLQDAFFLKTEVLRQRLISQGYTGIIISPRDVREFGREAVNDKLRALYNHPDFPMIYQNKDIRIFQILNLSQ